VTSAGKKVRDAGAAPDRVDDLESLLVLVQAVDGDREAVAAESAGYRAAQPT
jgi:hypothetical protein